MIRRSFYIVCVGLAFVLAGSVAGDDRFETNDEKIERKERGEHRHPGDFRDRQRREREEQEERERERDLRDPEPPRREQGSEFRRRGGEELRRYLEERFEVDRPRPHGPRDEDFRDRPFRPDQEGHRNRPREFHHAGPEHRPNPEFAHRLMELAAHGSLEEFDEHLDRFRRHATEDRQRRELEELRENDPEMFEQHMADRQLEKRSDELAERFQRTEGPDAREEIKIGLAEVVEKHFHLRQRHRMLEAERLERELDELRESIERREENAGEIIERRLSELLGEEHDLSF